VGSGGSKSAALGNANFGDTGAPGSVDPFTLGMLGQLAGQSSEAMTNRYKQLGLGVPSGSPQSAAASGTNLNRAGPGTSEQMDLGSIPSLTGGISGMETATTGLLQNLNMTGSPQQAGSKSGGSKGGTLGSLTGGLL
jgi:hypothetical protein